MAMDVSEIVGAANMDAARKDAVLEALRELATDLTTKKYIFGRWARLVNYVATASDFEALA